MKNEVYDQAEELYLPVPEGTASGTAVCVGNIPGVCQTKADSNNKASVKTRGAVKLSVEAKNKAGNSKVSVGDIIYLKGTTLGKNNEEGTRFGYALEEVASGSTTSIVVKIGY